MNYQDFLTNVTTHIEERLDDSVSLQLQSITKNNGTHLDGLVIMNSNVNISPTIYLNPYYHRYLDGVSLSDIYDDILCTYQTHKPKESIDISFFTDYHSVKDRIIFKLVHYEKNKTLLQNLPHFRYLDFAVIFNCLLNASSEDHATILIYNEHLSYWGITKDELYQLALKNTPKLLPSRMDNMLDLISHLFIDELPDEDDLDFQMYVLTNEAKLYGASVVLYEGLLQKISDDFEKDLILLPSSVHEVIIIPISNLNSDSASLESFTAMVQEVNETQITDDEFLSSHAYYYDRLHHCLRSNF